MVRFAVSRDLLGKFPTQDHELFVEVSSQTLIWFKAVNFPRKVLICFLFLFLFS